MWISYLTRAQSLVRIVKYDAASRGPWGSLELLWVTKARYFLLLAATLFEKAFLIFVKESCLRRCITHDTVYWSGPNHAINPYCYNPCL